MAAEARQVKSNNTNKSYKRRRSLSAGLSVMVAIMILVSTVAVGVLAYFAYRADTIDMHSKRCLAIAISLAAEIDGDGMERALTDGVRDEQWDHIKAVADRIAVDNDLLYLYIVDTARVPGYFTYYVEGFNPAVDDDPVDFLYLESVEVYDDLAFVVIETGVPKMTGIYNSSDDDVDYGMVVTGYAPIFNSAGEVVGLVGADVSMDVALANVNAFAIRTSIIAGICVLVFVLIAILFIRIRVSRPVSLVISAAEKLAEGDPGTVAVYEADDEIGELFKAFNKMSESLSSQIEVLKRVADGDLSVTITPRGERDVLAFAIRDTVTNLQQMLELFRKSAESLEASAGSIAAESTRVSKDATEESEIAGGINLAAEEILDNTLDNAYAAGKANELIAEMADMAMHGSIQIERMVEAVSAIEHSYSSITKIVDTIESIAFQTNILALNAAVEAARAGRFGKGFTVVADEVRNLAAKSSASAKSTGELIDDALEQVSSGVEIAKTAADTFNEIVDKIGESGEMLCNISQASALQADSIALINQDIERIGEMIRRTAVSAENSANISDKLSERAKQLAMMLEKYKLH